MISGVLAKVALVADYPDLDEDFGRLVRLLVGATLDLKTLKVDGASRSELASRDRRGDSAAVSREAELCPVNRSVEIHLPW